MLKVILLPQHIKPKKNKIQVFTLLFGFSSQNLAAGEGGAKQC